MTDVTPDPDLVDALQLHAQCAHDEQPRRFQGHLAVLQSMDVLQATAVLIQTALAEHVGRSVDGFVARHADDLGHYAAPKIADAVAAIVSEFGGKAEQAAGGS